MNSQDFSSLKDRVVLITGGSGHIGSALTIAFLTQGCKVVTTDIHANRIDPEILGFEFSGQVRHRHIIADLRDLAAVAELPLQVQAAFGGLDIIVAGAAFTGDSMDDGWTVPFTQQDESLWADALKINLTSNFTLVKAASPLLTESGNGSAIFLGSIYGMVAPQPKLYEGLQLDNPAGYAVSKAGLTQLAQWLASTMGPDVRVNTVTPGGIFRDQDPTFIERYESRTPLGRMATEEDVVGPVLFLASDLSKYVTGINLVVDGGFSLW